MTKDRRLGRGLAALLGSPLEESSSIDGSVLHSTPTANTTAAGMTTVKVGNEAPRAQLPATPHTSQPSALRVAQGTERPVPERVTGAVPLSSTEPRDALRGRTLELNVHEIENNPFQPRRKFNEEEIASLAESLKEHKQLQPILVRKVGGRFQLISGERRLRATIHAGLETIRAEVRQADDRLVAELAIVENLQRKDLDAIEKALSFRRYINEHKCTQDELAKRLKIDRSTIANLMRLLELPEQIQEWIQLDKVTAGHAKALLPLGDEAQQLTFANRILEDSWSVRETERQVAAQIDSEDGIVVGPIVPKTSSRKRTITPQIASLEQQLRLSLGTKIEIRQGARGNGKMTIQFASAEEFERICQLICPDQKRNVAA